MRFCDVLIFFWGVDLSLNVLSIVCGSSVFVFDFVMHYFVSILVLQSS